MTFGDATVGIWWKQHESTDPLGLVTAAEAGGTEDIFPAHSEPLSTKPSVVEMPQKPADHVASVS